MFEPLTYQIYEEYSSVYIIDMVDLNQYILTPNRCELDQWFQEYCYYTVPTHNVPDFLQKINHNLRLAKQRNDTSYLQYICRKLSIEVNTETWEYTPNKIKIKLKAVQIKGGIRIQDNLSRLLSVTQDHVFKYKSEVIRLIHRYIYQNQLQNRYDRKVITPDEALKTVLIPLRQDEMEYTYMNLPHYIGWGLCPP